MRGNQGAMRENSTCLCLCLAQPRRRRDPAQMLPTHRPPALFGRQLSLMMPLVASAPRPRLGRFHGTGAVAGWHRGAVPGPPPVPSCAPNRRVVRGGCPPQPPLDLVQIVRHQPYIANRRATLGHHARSLDRQILDPHDRIARHQNRAVAVAVHNCRLVCTIGLRQNLRPGQNLGRQIDAVQRLDGPRLARQGLQQPSGSTLRRRVARPDCLDQIASPRLPRPDGANAGPG